MDKQKIFDQLRCKDVNLNPLRDKRITAKMKKEYDEVFGEFNYCKPKFNNDLEKQVYEKLQKKHERKIFKKFKGE